MKLVVGLGNIGAEYANTRHNIGFMLLDSFDSLNFSFNSKMEAYEAFGSINNEKILYIKPTTYMNLSGNAVIRYVNYYKLSLDDIIVIQDDLDMELGKVKFLYNHSSGGHNGIKDISLKLGSDCYLRLKVGISNNKTISTKDYVLDKFSKSDLDKLNNVFLSLKDVVSDFVILDRNSLFQKYNTRV